MTSCKRRTFLRGLAGTAVASTFPSVVLGQSTQVSTVAGIGEPGYEQEPRGGILALETPVANPYGVVPGPADAL